MDWTGAHRALTFNEEPTDLRLKPKRIFLPYQSG